MKNPLHVAATLVGSLWLLAGCSGPTGPNPTRGLDAARASTQGAGANAAPPVLIEGTPVEYSELSPRLEEAAGSVILEELALNRILDRQIADAGITIPRQDIDAERDLLARTLTDEAKLTAAQARSMIDNVRKTRGLGPIRFSELLERNAKLRALVRPGVEVSTEEVDRALAAEFGPRARVRVITVPTERRAMEIKQDLVKGLIPPGEPDTPAAPRPVDPLLVATHIRPADAAAVSLRFAQAALESSDDTSAPRGGLIESISPVDQSLPASVRKALEAMNPGDLSGVIAADRGYMLVLMESRTEGRGSPTPEDRALAQSRLFFRKERIAMDRLARQLLGAAKVSPLDQSLRWSWEARPQ